MAGPEDAALILAMALAGLAGQYCYITAMSMGDASFLSSMDYLRLPIAALADWLIFKLLPGFSVWLGAGIIIAATLFITVREARLGRKRGPKAPGAP
jgi:drug/metabolite transporter (DMT)-like permease